MAILIICMFVPNFVFALAIDSVKGVWGWKV